MCASSCWLVYITTTIIIGLYQRINYKLIHDYVSRHINNDKKGIIISILNKLLHCQVATVCVLAATNTDRDRDTDTDTKAATGYITKGLSVFVADYSLPISPGQLMFCRLLPVRLLLLLAEQAHETLDNWICILCPMQRICISCCNTGRVSRSDQLVRAS